MERTETGRDKHTVFIPVVRHQGAGNAGDTAGELLEIYSTSDEPRAPGDRARLEAKGLEPVVADLRRSPSLYEAGVAAVAAFRKLRPRPRAWAFYQRLWAGSAARDQQVRLVNARGPTEGRSAELGLALALFMTACASSTRCVFATGALSRLQSPDEPSRNPWRADDIEVVEVDNLPVKLALIRDALTAGNLGDATDETQIVCITPQTCAEGRVHDLPEARQLVAIGVRLIPVIWLSEALRALGATHMRATRIDRWLASCALILCAGAVFTVAGAALVNSPIPLAFRAGAGQMPGAPYISCGSNAPSYPLVQDGPRKQIPAGTKLGWQVAVEDAQRIRTTSFRALGWTGYHLTHVLLSETSATKVRSDVQPTLPGEVAEFWWELDSTPETMALVVLATRFHSLDPEQLMNVLRDRFPAHFGPEQEPLDITEAVNFLRQLAPGIVSFVFESRTMPKRC
ncbi:MAG: hypothetical protein ACR2RL_05130 [Gammaproteobacteria bacterium]